MDCPEYRITRGTQQWQAWQMNCGTLNIDGEPTGANNDVTDATCSFLSGDFFAAGAFSFFLEIGILLATNLVDLVWRN